MLTICDYNIYAVMANNRAWILRELMQDENIAILAEAEERENGPAVWDISLP